MTRADLALAALATVAGAVAVAFTWQPGLASLYDDSVFYLMMAQAMSPFGSASPAVLATAPFDTYPPFLPLVVALAGGAFDWRIAHAVVALSFGASVFLLGVHARRITGSAPMGFAAALVYALMPGVWLNVKGILSEFPYMALSFGALVAHARWREAPASLARTAAFGLLLAALLLTRTIAVALMAAIALCEALAWWRARDARRLAHAAAALAVPVVVLGLWILLRPTVGQDAYAEFGQRMAQGAAEGGAAFLAGMARANASAIVDAWLNALLIFWGEWWKPGFLLAIALGAAGLAATVARALRAEADALYALAFLAIILAWPFPGQQFRLALPIIPLVMLNALWAWQRFVLRLAPASAGRRAPWAAVLPLALSAPAIAFYVVARANTPEEAPSEWRKADIAEFYRVPSGPAAASNARAQIEVFKDLARIRESTPESARVLWYSPAYVALLAQRRGVRLERPADAAALAAQARAAKADYVYLANLHPRDSAHRLGNPLDPAAFAEALGTPVWRRSSPDGELRAALYALDREKIDNFKKTP
jgi:4-amino-4-deoxy-L-arabinose transferase-like glycosyltransferase